VPNQIMRLLDTHNFKIREFGDDEIPPYAILSHTWDEEEVIFQDMEGNHEADKKRYEKIKNCCSVAKANGFHYIWTLASRNVTRTNNALQKCVHLPPEMMGHISGFCI
jgi:hypothetical protein